MTTINQKMPMLSEAEEQVALFRWADFEKFCTSAIRTKVTIFRSSIKLTYQKN